jgi:hypothetical protein
MKEDGVDLYSLVIVNKEREFSILRRLSQVAAPEGKTRVIAIVDYWTQCALRPLHDLLLKRLSVWFGECDRTLNQLGFKP